ncbi:hypothetical protein JMJ58_14830 [Haloterrigena salifodinae]|uniref:Uncharacterized protein n=1 Tax=Haloterrigena salifodinae TaxID=2675099 RepID=A0A8T8DX96_9EURY|nr:hypothetical protein [Haloterrigena salifodinae]QRV14208.1 hypothetical protein JMJ58_14830 [Haloterrigena salifodinae]
MTGTNHENYREQLAPAETGGAAFAEPSDDAGTTVRINPIREGDRTVGHRPGSEDDEVAIWDSDPVKEAVENGALDGATIVKGRGGKNPHYGFDEQVPADSILGRVEEWEYEDGVGPVGKAQLADEGIADRIELDLLDVSGDWLRRLGEYDDDRGGKPVEEVLGLPRVTVVERGASNASIDIEPETAEALGYNPDAPDVQEQHADALTPAPPDGWVDFYDQLTGGDAVAVSGAYYSDGDYYVSIHPEGDALEEPDPSLGEAIATIGPFPADRSEGSITLPLEEPIEQSQTLHAVLREADDGAGAPIEIDGRHVMNGAVVRVADPEDEAEYLADPDVSNKTIGAATGTSPDTPADTTDLPDMGSNDNELQEQLAEVRDERDELEDEKSDLKEQLAEKNSTIEDYEDRIDELEEEVGPIKELFAEIAVGDQPLDPGRIAETHNTEELVEMLAGDVEEDDLTYSEKVKEQLAAPLSPRGQGEEESGPDLGDVDSEQVEQLAGSVLSLNDMQRIHNEDISRREYLQREYDVDPAQYGSESSLRQAIDSTSGGGA